MTFMIAGGERGKSGRRKRYVRIDWPLTGYYILKTWAVHEMISNRPSLGASFSGRTTTVYIHAFTCIQSNFTEFHRIRNFMNINLLLLLLLNLARGILNFQSMLVAENIFLYNC